MGLKVFSSERIRKSGGERKVKVSAVSVEEEGFQQQHVRSQSVQHGVQHYHHLGFKMNSALVFRDCSEAWVSLNLLPPPFSLLASTTQGCCKSSRSICRYSSTVSLQTSPPSFLPPPTTTAAAAVPRAVTLTKCLTAL